jgi:hypothetical protein
MNRQDAKNAKKDTNQRSEPVRSGFSVLFPWRSWRLGGSFI